MTYETKTWHLRLTSAFYRGKTTCWDLQFELTETRDEFTVTLTVSSEGESSPSFVTNHRPLNLDGVGFKGVGKAMHDVSEKMLRGDISPVGHSHEEFPYWEAFKLYSTSTFNAFLVLRTPNRSIKVPFIDVHFHLITNGSTDELWCTRPHAFVISVLPDELARFGLALEEIGRELTATTWAEYDWDKLLLEYEE